MLFFFLPTLYYIIVTGTTTTDINFRSEREKKKRFLIIFIKWSWINICIWCVIYHFFWQHCTTYHTLLLCHCCCCCCCWYLLFVCFFFNKFIFTYSCYIFMFQFGTHRKSLSPFRHSSAIKICSHNFSGRQTRILHECDVFLAKKSLMSEQFSIPARLAYTYS